MTAEEILDALREVMDPELGINIVDLGFGRLTGRWRRDSGAARILICFVLTRMRWPCRGCGIGKLSDFLLGRGGSRAIALTLCFLILFHAQSQEILLAISSTRSCVSITGGYLGSRECVRSSGDRLPCSIAETLLSSM